MGCGGRGITGVLAGLGALLIVVGIMQLVSGIYFMITLPIFEIGSNIWTGIWSGLCGAGMIVVDSRKEIRRRRGIAIFVCITLLVIHVTNLVILQIGERNVFLTEDDRRYIVSNSLEAKFNTAIWLTTITTSVGIVISYVSAQYLLCLVVGVARIKGRVTLTRSQSQEGLHQRQVSHKDRFFPPSRLATLQVDQSLASPVHTASVGGGDGVLSEGGLRGVCSLGGGSKDTGSSSDGGGGVSVEQRSFQYQTNVKDSVNVSDGLRGEGDMMGACQGEGKDIISESVAKKLHITDNSECSIDDSVSTEHERSSDVVPYFLRNHPHSWSYILPKDIIRLRSMSTECSQRDPLSGTSQNYHQQTGTFRRSGIPSSKSLLKKSSSSAPSEAGKSTEVQPAFEDLDLINRNLDESCSSSQIRLISSSTESSTLSPKSRCPKRRPSVPPPEPPDIPRKKLSKKLSEEVQDFKAKDRAAQIQLSQSLKIGDHKSRKSLKSSSLKTKSFQRSRSEKRLKTSNSWKRCSVVRSYSGDRVNDYVIDLD